MHEAWKRRVEEGETIMRELDRILKNHLDLKTLRSAQKKKREMALGLTILYHLRSEARDVARNRIEERKKHPKVEVIRKGSGEAANK